MYKYAKNNQNYLVRRFLAFYNLCLELVHHLDADFYNMKNKLIFMGMGIDLALGKDMI